MRTAVIATGILLSALVPAPQVWSQYAAPYTPPTTPYAPAPSTPWYDPSLGAAPTTGQGAQLGGTIQPFDPYALPGNIGAPGLGASSFGTPYAGPTEWPGPAPAPLPGGSYSPYAPPVVPPLGAPYGTPAPSSGLQPQPLNPYYNGSPYAASTPTPAAAPPYSRLFQDTGIRSSYLFGNDTDSLSLLDVEASTSMFFANCLGMANGLRVTPGFIFHWTDGPAPPVTADVPDRLYSAYLDFQATPQWSPRFGAEFDVRVGAYSDFVAFDQNSIRLSGTGVGVYQVSPAWAAKLGISYINRVDLKLLPAVGMLWTPNPRTRWDIFFPRPKLSNYWTTMGNKQVWWYLGGEYGGGTWTIERTDPPYVGVNDRMDINDIRVFLGVECWNSNRCHAFGEFGYVFERELVYYVVPSDSLQVDSTFMLRGGISW